MHECIRIITDEHVVLSSMLQSISRLIKRGPSDEPEVFFNVLRAMLFYIAEFPERLHHPKESALLFPRVARLVPETVPVIAQLDREHAQGLSAVRELQHLLLAWELLGESARATFESASHKYLAFHKEHIRLEEAEILPAAKRVLSEADWKELDAAFASNCDPFTGKYPPDPSYDRLFTHIMLRAPAPIGAGRY